jgi:Fur family ferric uptake transcriptional regulator
MGIANVNGNATDMDTDRNRSSENQGYRRTKVREAMLEIFRRTKAPLAAADVRERLARKGHAANKTTVYRALTFFKETGVLKEVRLADRETRYELSAKEHHHHLVCVGCRTVEDVVVVENFDREERKIEAAKKFKILDHSLEFFGLCVKCR